MPKPPRSPSLQSETRPAPQEAVSPGEKGSSYFSVSLSISEPNHGINREVSLMTSNSSALTAHTGLFYTPSPTSRSPGCEWVGLCSVQASRHPAPSSKWLQQVAPPTPLALRSALDSQPTPSAGEGREQGANGQDVLWARSKRGGLHFWTHCSRARTSCKAPPVCKGGWEMGSSGARVESRTEPSERPPPLRSSETLERSYHRDL